MSTVVRIPKEIDASIKAIAAMQGRAAGEVIADAWHAYIQDHREEFAADFERAAQAVRTGDTAGLAALMSRFNEDRAATAAKRARTSES